MSKTGDARLITTGPFDLLSISGADGKGGWLYYIASPENATQRYLYRSRLDGKGKAERVSPASQPGTHTYTLSPDCTYAFHGHSTFTSPGVSDIVHLPDHKVVRVLQDNADLKAKVEPMLAGRTEFFQADIGEGVTMDGWVIRPTKFDPANKYPMNITIYGEPAGTTVTDNWGVGLAAPQLGEPRQACVVEVESQLHELVNPRIVRATGDDNDLEGCLSIPGYVAYVTRRERVRVVAQNRLGRKIKVAGSGLLSRALQHEVDHLEGQLFIDYLESLDDLIPVSQLDEEGEGSEVHATALA